MIKVRITGEPEEVKQMVSTMYNDEKYKVIRYNYSKGKNPKYQNENNLLCYLDVEIIGGENDGKSQEN